MPTPWALFTAFAGQPWLPGSLYKIRWNYGVADVDIDLGLYKKGDYKTTVAVGIQSLDREFTWEIPNGLDNGKDYTILMTATATGETSESEEFTIGVEDVMKDELGVRDMIFVIAVSGVAMGVYAGLLYRIDAERWKGKHKISLQQFTIVCTSFADFTSDGAWAYKV